MKIEVFRDACCGADDQAGPLILALELDAQASFQKLVETVLNSGFLQYSSSHMTMLGFVDGVAAVRVFSPDHSKDETQYLIDPLMAVGVAVKNGSVDFRF